MYHHYLRTPTDYPCTQLPPCWILSTRVQTFLTIEARTGLPRPTPMGTTRTSMHSLPCLPAHLPGRLQRGTFEKTHLSVVTARSRFCSRSAYDLSQTHDQYYADGPSAISTQTQRNRRMKTPSGSNSSNSTVTPHDYRSRLSEPPAGNAHLMRKRSSPALVRPRGMTVGAIDHRPSTANPLLSPTQPLQPRRKASGSSSPSSSNSLITSSKAKDARPSSSGIKVLKKSGCTSTSDSLPCTV